MKSDLPNVSKKPLTEGAVEAALNSAFIKVYGTRFKPKAYSGRSPAIDVAAARRLHRGGMNVKQIAYIFGCSERHTARVVAAFDAA